MLKVQGLRLRPGEPESKLTKKLQRELGCEVQGFQVLRRSVDARKKEDVSFVYTLGVEISHENQVLKKCRSKKVSLYTPPEYHFPAQHLRLSQRPVIVGAGPAGLFCALMLARAGARPIVLERGRDVDTRTELVSNFWRGGELNPECNVQFGEGGAGTFSDGKLHTGVNDPRMQQILREFVAFGAPSEILWDANPHVGTDYLKIVVKNIRLELEKLGAEVRFSHRLTGILTEHGRVVGAKILSPEGAYPLKTGNLVLAIGHSARDTFRMLYDSGVPMEQKQFAMGVRIEQKQKDVTVAQFGAEIAGLPVATYKLSCHPDTGRGAFSFCVCPGGAGGGGGVPARAAVHQRHEQPRPERGEHQRRPAGDGSPLGFRHPAPPGRRIFAGKIGGSGVPAGRRELFCPLPAGGGFPRPSALHRPGEGNSFLRARGDVDGSTPVPAGIFDGDIGAGPAHAGEKAPGLRRSRRGAHGHREPQLQPRAHSQG